MALEGNWQPVSRRRFLARMGAAGGGLAFGSASLGTARTWASPSFKSDPFALGVASGEPLPGGIVLWTRLAPEPMDGGGMPSRRVPVQWEIAEDDAFKRVAQRGTSLAVPELAHSVHLEIDGLRPGGEYFYRFKVGPELSPTGRTRTAPAASERPAGVRFAFASCQHYEPAYGHMAQEDLDFVVHLGDYIYEARSSRRGTTTRSRTTTPATSRRTRPTGSRTRRRSASAAPPLTRSCGDGIRIDCAERLDPARTLTGAAQEAWLLDGLGRSYARWNVLARQVFFAQRDTIAGPQQRFSMDGWDGYPASRARVLGGIAERGVRNPVVLTGDVHNHWACELKANFDDRRRRRSESSSSAARSPPAATARTRSRRPTRSRSPRTRTSATSRLGAATCAAR